MLKLKLQSFGHLMWRVDSLEKTDAGRDWGQEEKGTTEDEMAGWHPWLDGRESEWTPGVGDGQGGLACCDSWDRKESDTTERLIWSDSFSSSFPIQVITEYSAEFPVLYSRSLLVIYFKYNSVYISVLTSQPILFPPSFPLVTVCLFSKSMWRFLFWK